MRTLITEESLMKLYKYPDYEAHKQKHDKLTGYVLELKQKFDSGQISNPINFSRKGSLKLNGTFTIISIFGGVLNKIVY